MRPDDHELDAEIRGHLALSVKDRIERGEDPEAARLAALREFGYVPAIRESMRRVWFSRWFDAATALGRDMRVALRSLRRAKGLAATVVVTLALGIGANAAIFSVVRGVLLRPLVNRDEDRLIYIRQSGPGIGAENMTFSVPEIDDVKSRVTTIGAFGDFSTVDFTMIGLSEEPRVVKAGVVSGSFFDVMGLRPVLGRLLNAHDDGANAAGAVVLTHRFWTTSLNSDPTVIGKIVRLGPRPATVVGVLEPSVPYPADTEIIANVVTSPHHLGATMVTSRTHRMTELFGRLAPGASLEAARAELVAVHAAIMADHPESYSAKANVQLSVKKLRDQIASPARTILIVLLAAAAVVFVIACSNVANLILARSVRREGELAVRAALGAGPGALRRTLLAESLVLCGAGAVLGVVLAQPLVAMVSRYAARFSVRALEVTVDPSVLWIAAGLAIAAAVLLAYVPRLPSSHGPAGLGLASGSIRITPGTNRRLRGFATMQIAFSFVLLAGAGMLIATLVSLQTAQTGYNMRQVLAFNIPLSATGFADAKAINFYQEATRRISELPGVEGAAMGSFVPWRDAGSLGPGFLFTVEGYTPADGEEHPRGRMRMVAPGFFAVLGVPIVAGRDFTDDDRRGSEPVTIVSAERRAAAVPERRGGEPAPDVDRSGLQHLWEARADAHHRRRRRRGRRERGAGTGPDRLPGGVADRRRRPPVRARGGRSVRARAGSDARHPRDLAGPGGRARRNARGRARGSAVARPGERLRHLGIRRHCATHRRRRRGGRAGILGQRAHARVRRAAGDRIRSAPPGGGRAARGYGDRRDRDRRRRGGRLRARRRGDSILFDRGDAGSAARRGRCRRTHRGRNAGGVDPRCTRVAGRRAAGAPIGVGMTLIPIHVMGGTIAILSGLVALYALKGAQLHRKSGTIFVYAMLVMSLSGAVIAVGRAGAAMNIPAGLVTAYLVITSLLTVHPPSARSRRVERGAMQAAFALGLASLVSALVSAGSGNTGFVFPLLMFSALALSAGVGDRRMLRAGGLQGTRETQEAPVAHVRRAVHRVGVIFSGTGQTNSGTAPHSCAAPDPAPGAGNHGVLAVALPP